MDCFTLYLYNMSTISIQLVAERNKEFWNLSVLQGMKRQKNSVVFIKGHNCPYLGEEFGDCSSYERCRVGALDEVSGAFLEQCTTIFSKKNKKDMKVLKRTIDMLEGLPKTNVRDETLESLKRMKKFLKLECSLSIIKAKIRDERDLEIC